MDVAILDNTDGDHARAAEVGHPLLLDISVRNLARVQENTENDLQNAERLLWGNFKIFLES